MVSFSKVEDARVTHWCENIYFLKVHYWKSSIPIFLEHLDTSRFDILIFFLHTGSNKLKENCNNVCNALRPILFSLPNVKGFLHLCQDAQWNNDCYHKYLSSSSSLSVYTYFLPVLLLLYIRTSLLLLEIIFITIIGSSSSSIADQVVHAVGLWLCIFFIIIINDH